MSFPLIQAATWDPDAAVGTFGILNPFNLSYWVFSISARLGQMVENKAFIKEEILEQEVAKKSILQENIGRFLVYMSLN